MLFKNCSKFYQRLLRVRSSIIFLMQLLNFFPLKVYFLPNLWTMREAKKNDLIYEYSLTRIVAIIIYLYKYWTRTYQMVLVFSCLHDEKQKTKRWWFFKKYFLFLIINFYLITLVFYLFLLKYQKKYPVWTALNL